MKNVCLAMTTLLVVLSGCGTTADKAERQARIAKAVEQMLADRHYKVDIEMMYPLRGASMNVAGTYSLEVKGDTLVSYLPYRGQAYNVPYGGGKGLNFTALIDRYAERSDSKGHRLISIETKSEGDVLQYELQVFGNGQTSVDVHCRERDPISFSGVMDVE